MNERQLLPYQSAIAKAADDFTNAAGGLEFDREKVFAMQALLKADSRGRQYALEVANANPASVRMAMANLAATGLTLNPTFGFAYLVPRDNAIVLDVSYRGLIKIATDTGAIEWGRAAVVYERDVFNYYGPTDKPAHVVPAAFVDRGPIVGAYCIAKTSSGDYLTDILPLAEIEKIRGKSTAFTKSKSGPWVEWFSEMACKAVIKRAQKTWPHSERLSRAIEIANESEGGYTLDALPLETVSEQQAATLRDLIEATGVDPVPFLSLFEVNAVEALPRMRYAEAVATLNRKGLAHADR